MNGMRQIGRGGTADIYEYEENRVMKLFKEGYSEEAIQREFQISQFVYVQGIRTPRPFELILLNNRQGILFQRISGLTMLNSMIKNPLSINKLSSDLATLHHHIHSHHAGSGLRQQKEVLSDNIEASSILSAEEKTQILASLTELPNEDQLCHGDFHPDNVMVGDDGYWMIDWQDGRAGDPASDVARSIVLISYGTMPDETPSSMKDALHDLRNRLKDEYIERYLALSGKAYADIDQWILPVAAARLAEQRPPAEQEQLLSVIRERLQGNL